MIKVCFDGMYSVMDSTSAKRMREELITLAERDSHMELWLTGCYNSYEKIVMEHSKELKKLFPEKQIDVVAIVDPLKCEKNNWEEVDEVLIGFPRGSVDRIDYAPRIEGKSELLPHRFIEHHRKVFRWIVSQCDVIIVYHYDGVPDPTNTEIKRIRKKGEIEIISVYNPEVAEEIDLYIEGLDGRDKTILQGLRTGRTYKSLAEELGISHNRVQQISHHAIRYMMQAIRHKVNS